jgi:hypothetical protein
VKCAYNGIPRNIAHYLLCNCCTQNSCNILYIPCTVFVMQTAAPRIHALYMPCSCEQYMFSIVFPSYFVSSFFPPYFYK